MNTHTKTIITATAAAVAAPLLVAALAVPAAAATQTVTEASCSGDSLVQHELAAGTTWEMCWRVDTYRGLVLDQVAFQPNDAEQPIMVLDSIGLAQLNVPYDTGVTEYNDVTTYQVGGRRMQDQTALDCVNGEVRTAWLTEARPAAPALCITEEDSGIANRSNVANEQLYIEQGTDLVLHTMSRIGWYEYQTEYRFHDDGEISVRLGATGDLSPNDFADAVNRGWPLGVGQTGFAVNHYHSAFWRVDFGIDSAATQNVERIVTAPTGEHGTTGDTGRTAILETEILPVEREGKMFYDNLEQVRVVNPDSLNTDGHARSYEIIMDSDRAYNLNPESDYDIAFTQPKVDEIHASYNLVPTKPNAAVTDYVADNEVLTDPVAWVNVGFHHVNRDEDQSPMPIHWQGFTLYPRDFSAMNPMQEDCRRHMNGDVRETGNTYPCAEPTEEPTEEPTSVPSEGPSEAPTEEPTEEPTSVPTEGPTEEPSGLPTDVPSDVPTDGVTEMPTDGATDAPTAPGGGGGDGPPAPGGAGGAAGGGAAPPDGAAGDGAVRPGGANGADGGGSITLPSGIGLPITGAAAGGVVLLALALLALGLVLRQRSAAGA
ncbi:PT domain-containing protein [Georgenia faecalis]|uniref:copper amine oxidase n=1 Tax=Georgenia faecalis TaxID=2483799 RepID=UPI000FD9804C|nr:PT domain-containing protein [Georgenia faecalis]